MFNEICIYDAKIGKQEEIEALMREVAEFYRAQPGVIDVRYIKRTHRQEDFNTVKAGEPPIRLTRYVGKVTYILYLVVEDEKAHTPTHSLGLAFYGAAAIAYDRVGIAETPEAYDRIAAEGCAKMEAALRAIAVENEPNPAKIKWNC